MVAQFQKNFTLDGTCFAYVTVKNAIDAIRPMALSYLLFSDVHNSFRQNAQTRRK